MYQGRGVLLATSIAALLGCQPEDERVDLSSRGIASDNGVDLNGVDLNGIDLNGIDLNGIDLNGIDLNGIDLNGIDLNGVDLNGTSLVGTTADGDTLSGTDFIGATMTGLLVDGRTITLRIDDMFPGWGANADIWYYSVSWYRGTGDWAPICHTAWGSPSVAIPTTGRWNYQQGVPGGGSKTDDPGFVTWSCVNSAIGKCVRLGYKPWKVVHGISLNSYHQACVRLHRADFCGDGTPYTVNGRLINLYDGLGVQQDTERWNLEAEWDSNGARCMMEDHRSSGVPIPCYGARRSSDCGRRSHFQSGTLLMSEIP